MLRDEVGDALAYLYWARDRIARAAARPHAAFRSEKPSATRSLRATLAHQVENEWAWRLRLRDGRFPSGDVVPEDDPTLGALLDRWHQEEREMRAWFAGLTEADLAARPEDLPATWRCLLYGVNHGTQQFTEAALLLTQLGHSPGEIGYLAFCSEIAGPVRRQRAPQSQAGVAQARRAAAGRGRVGAMTEGSLAGRLPVPVDGPWAAQMSSVQWATAGRGR